MRRRDQSINSRRAINPIPDQDFTIADKYPEKERQITTPDIADTVIKAQEKISNVGFVMPMSSMRRRQSAESRRTGEVSRARDISSQGGGITHMGIGFGIGSKRSSELKAKLKAGKPAGFAPVGQAAKPEGLWARFMAWIKKIFGG